MEEALSEAEGRDRRCDEIGRLSKIAFRSCEAGPRSSIEVKA